MGEVKDRRRLKNMDLFPKGITINGRFSNHLRFADDIIVLSKEVDALQNILIELRKNSKPVGLEAVLQKIHIMRPSDIQVTIENQTFPVMQE